MAKTRWVGKAIDVADVWTFDAQNTWATGDTATVSINSKDLTLTVGSTSTTAQIAADIVDMINGDDANDDETRSQTGDNVTEWQSITASVSGSTVTLTADDEGVPFEVSVSETTAGTGTLSSPSNATVATGKNFWDNADNWDTGSVPTAGDDVYIDSTAISILYGLSNAGNTLTSLTIEASFTGTIGLPKTNAAGYPEYRDEYLQVDCTTCTIGRGVGQGSNRIKIDFGAVQNTTIIHGSGQGSDQQPAIFLKGTDADNAMEVAAGTVGVGYFGGESATVKTYEQSGGDVTFGEDVTLDGTGSTWTQTGGTAVARSNLLTVDVDAGSLFTSGSGTASSLTIGSGGQVQYNSSGTISTLVNRGALDLSQDSTDLTITTTTLHEGGRIVYGGRSVTHTNFSIGGNVREVAAA